MTTIYDGIDPALVDDENDELEANIETYISEEGIDLATKCEMLAKAWAHWLRVNEACKDEMDRLLRRSEIARRRVDSIANYLGFLLRLNGTRKVHGNLFTVSLRKCPPSCIVTDASRVSPKWIRTKTETSVDRKAILDNFKTTGEIPDGVEIITDRETTRIK